MKISLLGATGLVGNEFLILSLQTNEITEVQTFSRREIDQNSPKLKTIIDPDFSLESLPSSFFLVDAMICTLGTTLKKAKSKANFQKVDFELPLKAARLFQKNKGNHFILVTAIGANSKSPFFYNCIKGKLENEAKVLHLPQLTIVRPSLILGDRQESRPGENIAKALSPFFNPLLRGRLAPLKAVNAIEIAKAIREILLQKPPTTAIQIDRFIHK